MSKAVSTIDVANKIIAKRQKLYESYSEEHNATEERSVIEKLPNGIIQRILSFLPTKDAVKTSILSKKWQFRWMSIFNLDFNDGTTDERKRTLFMNFVERAMMLRGAADLQKFSLTCVVHSDAPRIHTWVATAVKHKVEELILRLEDIDFAVPFGMPSSLFSCQTLKVLELSMFIYLTIPSAVSLPNVKELRLSQVTFMDDLSVLQLFSGCPNVQKLTLDECFWGMMGIYVVNAATIALPLLEFMYISEHPVEKEKRSTICQFCIFGTNLKTFHYKGTMLHDYCFCSSSLVDASIDVRRHEEFGIERDDAYRLYKLLRDLSNVKSLKITLETFEVLSYAEELYPHLPVFQNLTNLQLCPNPVDNPYKVLLQRILQNSPLLDCRDFGYEVV